MEENWNIYNMTTYVQKFKEKFPDKNTPESIIAYHGGDSKINSFSIDKGPVIFYSDENKAREHGIYVTKAIISMNRTISPQSYPRRTDIVYMVTHSAKLKPDEYFDAVDNSMRKGSSKKCYEEIKDTLYADNLHLYVTNMLKIGYDGVISKEKDLITYEVFNPKSIKIINQ